eukprot:scaffold26195_cov129-Isochrysis_galbana.AAC.2
MTGTFARPDMRGPTERPRIPCPRTDGGAGVDNVARNKRASPTCASQLAPAAKKKAAAKAQVQDKPPPQPRKQVQVR